MVVRRELSLGPGDRIDWACLDRDRLRLLETELFASIELRAQRDTLSDRPVLLVVARERPAFLALPTMDYSEEDGITAGALVQDLNFRGRAENAGVAGGWGGRRFGQLWWSTRWVAGRRLGLALGLTRSRRSNEGEGTIEDRTTGAIGLGFARGPTLSFPLGVGTEKVKTRPDPDAESTPGRLRDDDHRWVSAGVWRDTRGYRARATRGTALGAGLTAHGGILGGTTSMEQYRFDAAIVRPTGRATALTVASRLVVSRGEVPSYLRLGLGGSGTLRGSGPNRWRGKSRWTGWLEERIPLIGRRTLAIARGKYHLDLTVDGALFVDAGAIWEGSAREDGRAPPHWGAGAGLRIVVPFVSVLNLDLATDGRQVRIHTSTGVRF